MEHNKKPWSEHLFKYSFEEIIRYSDKTSKTEPATMKTDKILQQAKGLENQVWEAVSWLTPDE